MIAEHMLNEQFSPSLCSAFCCSGDNMYIFGQSVNKDKNSVMACFGLRKTRDKVSRDTVLCFGQCFLFRLWQLLLFMLNRVWWLAKLD